MKMKNIISKANLTQTPSILLMIEGIRLIEAGKTQEGFILIIAGFILQEIKYRRYSQTQ